jgi:hypothetical protein
MQVMPGSGEFVGRRHVGRELDLTDPRDNVVAGIVFLQHLWELTAGDAQRALAANMDNYWSRRQFLLDVGRWWPYSSGQGWGQSTYDYSVDFCRNVYGQGYSHVFNVHVQ